VEIAHRGAEVDAGVVSIAQVGWVEQIVMRLAAPDAIAAAVLFPGALSSRATAFRV
jgi:hypothetical protein